MAVATRIKGSAIPKRNGWGWKVNVFMNEEGTGNPLTINSPDGTIFKTREKAVDDMKSHVGGIQQAMQEGLNSFEDYREQFSRRDTLAFVLAPKEPCINWCPV